MNFRTLALVTSLVLFAAPVRAADLSLGASLAVGADAVADVGSRGWERAALGTIDAELGLFRGFGLGLEYMSPLDEPEPGNDELRLYSGWMRWRSAGRLYDTLRVGYTLVPLFAGVEPLSGANVSTELAYERLGGAEIVRIGARVGLF